MSARKLERDLFLAQRTLGDARAARRGPGVLAGRLARRAWHRALWRALRKAGA